MPSLVVGQIKITTVGDGTVNFGDTRHINPKNTAKSYLGSGSAVTGDFLKTSSFVNSTATVDNEVIDADVTGGI
ncbi:spore germination protein [Fictibacillus sp. Mic-4]|uniref:spore germination protein n=1 Tax=Fictibacillus TaxID=1329200 RepID=UPI00041373F3|nr:spore germination protein [Fictibacillus gelatini]